MSELLPPQTCIGAVALTVSNLARSLDFYQARLGLRFLGDEAGAALLGADRPFLRLTENPGARKPPRTTGLYHFAVLVPNRFELAQLLRRLSETETPIQGGADHGVSEAVYLADPDGTGIEVYADRPADDWPKDAAGRVEMGTDELDVDSLMDALEANPVDWPGMAAGTRMGHVHLHVGNLSRAEVFYTGVLGFKLMQRYGGAAAFLSAGGYHHHVGINTWAGAGAPPPPPGSAGLREFDILLPTPEAVEAAAARLETAGAPFTRDESGAIHTHDPSENGIRLVAGGSE